MKKIIEVRKLYDYVNDIFFGCIGIVENSSEIGYFSFYNEQGEYNPNTIYEFDIKNPNPSVLNYHLANCNIKDSYLKEELPEDLKSTIQQALKKHEIYNEENNFPREFLQTNQLYMVVESKMEVERNSRSSAAQYNAYGNSLHLEIEKWQELTSEELIQMQNTILHEMGHLKVTQRCLKNNTLFVQCGFNRDEITLQPIFLPNGNIFYKPVEGKQKIYKPKIIIEEMLNDFDCSQVSKNFHGHYPNFGSRLNNLCDNNLQIARYRDGMNILNDYLLTIIKSKDALEELLGTLYASVYSYDKWDRKSSEEQANQLILKYEKEKQRRR